MPKVSVIVPVHNTQDYLEECIQSLRNQSLEDIEIILVNDGSTDKSLEIMESFQQKDGRIQVISLKQNVGVGQARNEGLEVATGDYIAFVDSDDLVAPDTYELAVGQALSAQADLVLFDSGTISSNGKEKSVWFKPIYGKADLSKIFHNTQPTNKLIDHRLIDRLQFRFLQGMGEGIIFELMAYAHTITTVDEKLYFYRARNGSLSTSPNIEKNKESLEANRILGERNPEFRDYFAFKQIEDLLQIIANAVKVKDKANFKWAKKELVARNYLKNPYLHTLYKNEFTTSRFIMKVYILPFNYSLSQTLMKLPIISKFRK